MISNFRNQFTINWFYFLHFCKCITIPSLCSCYVKKKKDTQDGKIAIDIEKETIIHFFKRYFQSATNIIYNVKCRAYRIFSYTTRAIPCPGNKNIKIIVLAAEASTLSRARQRRNFENMLSPWRIAKLEIHLLS